MSEIIENRTAVTTQNRELSWLNFNQRVLEEARDQSIPAMERFKFISIFSSNLDEFFMIRVGSLFDLKEICPLDIDHRSGMTPAQQLEKIYERIPGLIEMKKNIYTEVCQDLVRNGVEDLTYPQLSSSQRKVVKRYFRNNVHPMLSPIIIGTHHPFPHLNNKGIYLAALLQSRKKELSVGLIPIPELLPAYLRLPDEENMKYIRMENIVSHWADKLFGSYMILESTMISVTRNADLNFEDDKFEDQAVDFRTHVTSMLRSRDHLNVVRLEMSREVSEIFRARLARMIHVENHQIFIDSCPLNMKYVFDLAEEMNEGMKESLLYPPYSPRWPEDIDENHGMIEQIRQSDKLLFYPFDSTEPFLRLLQEAAERQDVISIKITIYRLASSSKIARLLCRAAENGKQVMVMMELRARFDEANNIQWSKLLENAGCQVIYGIEDIKCHSKICQITLRNREKLNYITQIGTGNYNEKTNTMYTDLSLMTADQRIGEEATTFFQNMMINNLEGEYEHLLVSPKGIEKKLFELIDEEIKKGKKGYICIKVNSLTDQDMMRKLEEASVAGVQVHLIVRGICCLLPQVAGHTDNIEITSIVGRYLEHARIYCFGSGEDSQLYISSADFMERNLQRRVEIACPVYDPEIRNQLKWILDTELQDNIKARSILPSGMYCRKVKDSEEQVNSQEVFMKKSIHKTVTYIPSKVKLKVRFKRLVAGMLDKIKED